MRIKNQMIRIPKSELKNKLEIDRDKLVVVEIDGKLILDEETFVDLMVEKFKLPDTHGYRMMDEITINWGAFDDRMTELSWFPDETNFILIIYHSNEFLSNNTRVRQKILNRLEDILYFWQEEVLHVVMNGKTRGFNVYLVD